MYIDGTKKFIMFYKFIFSEKLPKSTIILTNLNELYIDFVWYYILLITSSLIKESFITSLPIFGLFFVVF